MADSSVIPLPVRKSLIADMATRYGMDPKPFEETIRKTVMPSQHTVEEFAACLIVANQHNLNPITREIFFMRAKSGGIQPIVSVDGWVKITNSHPAFDGMEFEDRFDDKKNLFSITCKMFRRDRSKPTEVTEYMSECKGESPAWKKTPGRMLRHRAMIQCARYAFGFAGIMETDEFEQWNAQPIQKSAHKARKDGDFERLRAGVDACQSVDDLTAYLLLNKDDLEALPNSWQAHMSEHCATKRARLTATTVEPEPEASDELELNPDAFLEKLRFDIANCDDVTELALIAESNAEDIAKLPAEHKIEAARLLKEAAE